MNDSTLASSSTDTTRMLNYIPNVRENKIYSSLDNINNVIFSLGTYERDSFNQLFFPMNNKVQNNSIVFGIDPEYSNFFAKDKSSLFLTINEEQLKFSQLFIFKDTIVYYEKERNIQLYLIRNSIQTEYRGFRGETAESFEYTKDCSTRNDDWLVFYRLIEKLIRDEKNIYINNWVFTNSRYFKLINGNYKAFFSDIGHYFEYFPEIGFILNQLYGCWYSRCQIKLYITVYPKNINKMMIVNIQKTELSII